MLENDPAHSHYIYLKTGRKKTDPSTHILVVVLPGAGREAELAGMEMQALGLADLCQIPEEPAFLAVPSGCGGNEYGLTLSLLTRALLQPAALRADIPVPKGKPASLWLSVSLLGEKNSVFPGGCKA